jgi:translation initiation factor IF-1
MKLLVLMFIITAALLSASQSDSNPSVPKYNPAAEALYKGIVADVRDRQCPLSGGVGTHIIMRLENGNSIEVHLATTEFTKMTEMKLRKGDMIEVTGWKTDFQSVQTIFAREIKTGNDTYVFRAKDGMPAWVY